MLLSLTVHEAAHAGVARLRGDTTAAAAGRLSLNPIRHIDLFGTVILPLAGALSNLPIIGWAKPVPVDTRAFRYPRFDHMLVAAAGPVSNLVASAVCLLALAFLPVAQAGPWAHFAVSMVWINAYLAVFNLLPLPPLDGAAVATAVLPVDWARRYQALIAPYGIWILFGLFAAGGLNWMGDVAGAYVGLIKGAVTYGMHL